MLRLEDEGEEPDVLRMTPSERVAMVWPLTLQAWGFKEGFDENARVRRDIVRTIRNLR